MNIFTKTRLIRILMFFVFVHYSESTCPVNSNYFINRYFQFKLSPLSSKTSKCLNSRYKFQRHHQQQNHLGILDPTIIIAVMAIITLATLVSR